MRIIASGGWDLRVMLFVAITALMVPLTPAQSSPGPIFSTQTPTTGMGNGTFYVFLPLVKLVITGAGTATNVEVTSFLLSVQLEDSAGDLSAIQNVTISVPGSVVGAAGPRASSFLGIGLMVLVLAGKRFA
jgi:hypothetical protein